MVAVASGPVITKSDHKSSQLQRDFTLKYSTCYRTFLDVSHLTFQSQITSFKRTLVPKIFYACCLLSLKAETLQVPQQRIQNAGCQTKLYHHSRSEAYRELEPTSERDLCNTYKNNFVKHRLNDKSIHKKVGYCILEYFFVFLRILLKYCFYPSKSIVSQQYKGTIRVFFNNFVFVALALNFNTRAMV